MLLLNLITCTCYPLHVHVPTICTTQVSVAWLTVFVKQTCHCDKSFGSALLTIQSQKV